MRSLSLKPFSSLKSGPTASNPPSTNKKSRFWLWFGVTILVLITLASVAAPWLTNHDPTEMNLPLRFESPSLEHPFGLDENGSDVFAQVLYGSRVSLTVAFSVVIVSLLVGLSMGSLAGFLGGRVDQILMRFVDVLYAFPNFLLALVLVAVMGPSVGNLILAMCITSWTGFARLVRGEVLHLKQKEYVVTTKALGGGGFRQLILHIWPNLLGVVLVNATFALAGTIIAESGLSFLGLGAPVSTPTWGALLSSGRRFLFEAPHVSLFPGMMIVLLVLACNLAGDGLRDWLDPRQNQSR